MWDELAEKAEEQVKEYGVDLLLPIIQSGLVSLQPLPVTFLDLITAAADRQLSRQRTNEATRKYFDVVSKAVLAGNTHLLLDEDTSELVTLAIRDGIIRPSDVQKTYHTEVGLSAYMLQSLPSFDHATIEEVIHVRNELEQPLLRFRSAMIEYSTTIKSAQWDTDFQLEADLIYRQHVVPAVLDLEQEMKANSFVRHLLDRAVHSKALELTGALSATSLTVMFSHLNGWGDIAQLGLAAAGSGLVGEAIRTWVDAKQKHSSTKDMIEQNHLYFAYRANQMLAK
jgi:hypothetical protein